MAKRVLKSSKSPKLTAATRRTKKGKTPVKKAPPKKVQVDNLVTPTNKIVKGKRNKSTNFIKVASNASRDEFNSMGDRIKNSELEWSHFAMEGTVGYHHYKILK